MPVVVLKVLVQDVLKFVHDLKLNFYYCLRRTKARLLTRDYKKTIV